MKLNWNKKYTTIAVYCFIVIILTVLLINFTIKRDLIEGIVGTVSAVISPIIYGVVIAYLLNPIMNFFEGRVYKSVHKQKEKSKLRRAFSLTTTYILFLALLTAFLSLLIPQFVKSTVELISVVSDYVSKDLFDDIREFLSFNDGLVKMFDEYMQESDIKTVLTNFAATLTDLSSGVDSIIDVSKEFILGVFTVLKDLLLGLFFSIYFLASKELLSKQIKRFFLALFNARTNHRFFHIVHVIDEKFGQFVRGKILDSLIVMCIVYLLCWIFGMPYYPMIALIIGITDLIPVFGPFLGAIPSAVIIFIAEGGGFWKAIWFAVIILVVQQIDGNILAPLILGDKVGIEGVWIMTAVTVMGGFFGIPGMFFGVPIFAVIYTILGEWIHSRLVSKGIDPVNLPETPQSDETKIFGIPIHLPHFGHDEEQEEPDEDPTDDLLPDDNEPLPPKDNQ